MHSLRVLKKLSKRAARGEVTHKKFADMNRKERRAFQSSKSR